MPIYKVQLADGPERLVEATSAAAARTHVLKPLVVACEIATTADAVTLAMDGVKLEKAKDETPATAPATTKDNGNG